MLSHKQLLRRDMSSRGPQQRGTCSFLDATSGQNGILPTGRGCGWTCPVAQIRSEGHAQPHISSRGDTPAAGMLAAAHAPQVALVLVRRVVRVARGAVGVERRGVGLVDGQAFAPAADEVRIRNGRAADDHGVCVTVGNERDGLVAGRDDAESGVRRGRCRRIANAGPGPVRRGLLVKDAQVGQVERRDSIDQPAVRLVDVCRVQFGGTLDVVLGRDTDADAFGAEGSTTASATSMTKRTRFSGEPP